MKTKMKNPTLIITAGLPGAGKSTYLKNAGYKLPVVDPDEVKKSHPDYNPKNPQAIHDWSKKIARQQHLQHLANDESFIVDGTGTNVEKYVQYINEAKELGYNVELHYVKVSVATSIERNSKRSRTVPASIILEKAGIIDQTTKIIGQLCDEFITFEND